MLTLHCVWYISDYTKVIYVHDSSLGVLSRKARTFLFAFFFGCSVRVVSFPSGSDLFLVPGDVPGLTDEREHNNVLIVLIINLSTFDFRVPIAHESLRTINITTCVRYDERVEFLKCWTSVMTSQCTREKKIILLWFLLFLFLLLNTFKNNK